MPWELPHTFTSNIQTIDGIDYEWSTNSLYSPAYSPYRVADGNLGTAWAGQGGGTFPKYVQLHMSEPKRVGNFKLVQNSSGESDRVKDFRLLASNDGENWEDLGNGEIYTLADPQFSEISIEVDSEIPYSYFKVEILSSYTNYTGFSELYITEYTSPEPPEPTTLTKFLIRNNDTLYTIQDGELQALTETQATADLFREYGIDSVDTSLITGFDYPSILKWTEGEEISLNATLEAMPPLPQICYTRNYIFDDSVVGISSCQIVSDSQTRFAFSFDNGLTWKKIVDGEWVEVDNESDGMSAQEVNALTETDWEVVTMQWKVRFALYENSAVSTIKMNYKNEED